MDKHTFVFVTGLHRSGTSPLHRCLRDHPQISGFRNTGVAEDEGQHLQTVLPRGGAYGGPGRFGRHPEAHRTESHPLANAETATALFAQWSPHWDLARPYLIEKTPITLLRTRFFQALFPNAYFVVIIRHPAPVALATYHACVANGVAQGLTVDDQIEHWLLCHERFLADAPSLQRLQLLHYEDFVARPQATLDALYAFLNLPSFPNREEVEPDINDHYKRLWDAMEQDPDHQDEIERALCFEQRVQRFGYSLRDWSLHRSFSI